MSKKKKFYAVSVGHTTGIFETWEECKAQVDGFSGAKFKGFATQAQALAFLEGASSSVPRPTDAGKGKRKREEEEQEEEGGEAVPRVISPFFASPAPPAREAKRSRTKVTAPASAGSKRSTTLQKFFEENDLQAKVWVDKDWIVANWK